MSKNLPSSRKVIIISTGGTIAGITTGQALSGKEIVAAIPEIRDLSEVEVVEFCRIGSSKMTPNQWLALSKEINGIFARDKQTSGIVITHGTDTLEETAFFLHLTIKDHRPVILTGSMRTPDELSSDGRANLYNAIRLATSDQAREKGVLIALNESISSARDAMKLNNRRVQTFGSLEYGHLGFIDPDKISFRQVSMKPHTLAAEFDVRTLDDLPIIPIVRDYTDFAPEIISYLTSGSMDGLVFQTFPDGRLSTGARRGLSKVSQKIPIIISSKLPGGRIVGKIPPDLGLAFSNDLSAEKARILLMLSLAMGCDSNQIIRNFQKY